MEIRKKMDEKVVSVLSSLSNIDNNITKLNLEELKDLDYDLNKILYKYNLK